MKPSKVLDFSTAPTNLPELMMLGDQTVIIQDIEYLVKFRKSRPLDDMDETLVTFYLYEADNRSSSVIKLLNEQGIFQTGKQVKDYKLPEGMAYTTYRIYPEGKLTDYTKHSMGYVLYDYKD